jgi:hypothetical protein
MGKSDWLTLIVLVFLVVGLGGCLVTYNRQLNGGSSVETKTTQAGYNYSIVNIEGMPCLVLVNYTYNGYAVNSVTCDWSKYDSK